MRSQNLANRSARADRGRRLETPSPVTKVKINHWLPIWALHSCSARSSNGTAFVAASSLTSAVTTARAVLQYEAVHGWRCGKFDTTGTDTADADAPVSTGAGPPAEAVRPNQWISGRAEAPGRYGLARG